MFPSPPDIGKETEQIPTDMVTNCEPKSFEFFIFYEFKFLFFDFFLEYAKEPFLKKFHLHFSENTGR